jgi:hypothetical protein
MKTLPLAEAKAQLSAIWRNALVQWQGTLTVALVFGMLNIIFRMSNMGKRLWPISR